MMQAEIIISQREIKLLTPVALKPEASIRYVIEIPDDAVAEKKTGNRSELGQEIDAIMGRYCRLRPEKTTKQDKAVWHEHLVDKYGNEK